MLRDGTPYADLGADHSTRTERVKTANRLLRKLAELDFELARVRDRRAAA